MALDNTILTPAGNETELQVYSGHAIIDYPFTFVFEDDSSPYPFNGYSSGFFKIYQSRIEKKIKTFTTQVSRNANNLVLNCSASDMLISSRGSYYYELGYVRSGGYEIVLQYGKLIVK